MSKGKKVLMVAHQFPPMGGSGVQRSAKFAKYLVEIGFDVTVFTIEVVNEVMDDSLTEELKLVKIHRSKSYDITARKGFFGLVGKVIQRKLMIPDGQWYWYRRVRKQVLQLCKEINPDILYTTSFPYSDHLIGQYIKLRIPELRWVVDFRDEWTKNPYIIDMNRSAFRMQIERKMEAQVVTQCDHLITNSPQMLNGFLEDYEIAHKASVIPNGYDPYDFEGIDMSMEDSELFTITYTGAMYGRRSPKLFLQALKMLIDIGNIDPNKVKVKLVGHFLEKDKEKAYNWIGHTEILTFYPYMPHKESIRFLLESTVLLLIVGPGIGSKNFYTGKIFEYIYTKKPIFAVVPKDGAAASVILETRTGYVADSDDFKEIKETLLFIYQAWTEGKLHQDCNEEAIHQYSRYQQTKALGKIFDHLG